VPEATAIAESLRAAYPDDDPFALDAAEVARRIGAAGGDDGDDALLAAVLSAWDALLD
jgi:hypothetical protein